MRHKTFHRYYKLTEKVRAQEGWRLCNKWARQRIICMLLEGKKEDQL